MSVVVAIKEGNKIYIGADSQATRGASRISLTNPNNYKIWNVKDVDNCVMGSVGRLRDANIAKVTYGLVPEMVQLKGLLNYDYMIEHVVPRLFDSFDEYHVLERQNDVPHMNSSFVFAYKDKLYSIDSDGTVVEIDDCVAIGSGAPEAIGSLLSTDGESPINRIKKAIKASATNDIYVDYPIVITDTMSGKYKIFMDDDAEKAKKAERNKSLKNISQTDEQAAKKDDKADSGDEKKEN